MELIKILKYLDKKFPEKTAAVWDKSGLQIYEKHLKIETNREIKQVFITLDLSKAAFNEALKNGAELIITRHPFIFNELELEKNNPQKQQMIKKLQAKNVLVYSIHSNYDRSVANNLPHLLGQQLEIKKIKHFGPDKEGMLFVLKHPIAPPKLQKALAELFPGQAFHKSNNWSLQSLKEFYLVPGAGGGTMISSSLQDATFITGELKWNHWIYALDNQVQVLAIGHEMEDHFVAHTQFLLKNAFPNLQTNVYNHQSPFSIITRET